MLYYTILTYDTILYYTIPYYTTRRTPISYDSWVGSRDRCRSLLTSIMKRFWSDFACFTIISREYNSEHFPMKVLKSKKKMMFLTTILSMTTSSVFTAAWDWPKKVFEE